MEFLYGKHLFRLHCTYVNTFLSFCYGGTERTSLYVFFGLHVCRFLRQCVLSCQLANDISPILSFHGEHPAPSPRQLIPPLFLRPRFF